MQAAEEILAEVHQSSGPSSSRLRVAVVGCGAIAKQMHLPVLAGHPEFELVALVDRDRERAAMFADAYGVARVLTDAADLSRDWVDAAVLATPPAFHAEGAIELMRRGIHVLVEKPMAMETADAERMVRVAEETGCSLSVGFFRRLFPSVQVLRKLIAEQWYGPVVRFEVVGGGMYNWAAATLANMKRETAGGGVLMDFGAHMVDLMFALFDGPAEVTDYRDNNLGGIEADCTIDVAMGHAGATIPGRVELARLRDLGSYIRVECQRATLEFQITERFRIKISGERRVASGEKRQEAASSSLAARRSLLGFEAFWVGQDENVDWYTTFAAEFDDFAQSIRSGSPPVLSGHRALRTDRLIEQCYGHEGRIEEPWVTGGLASRPPMLAGWHTSGRMPRVLVTGASGFIGCRVAEILRVHEDCQVRGVVNNPGNAARLSRLDVEMVQADLGSGESLAGLVEGCDAVIHCAVGTAYGEPHKIKRVTVDGTRALGEAALKAGVERFVHLSSMAVYGSDDDVPPLMTEDHPGRSRKATNFYGWTKWLAEQALSQLHQRGLPLVILRPGRVFGPFGGTFVVNPLKAMAEGRFAWGGDPDAASDMVYVDNVVAACLQACRADLSQVGGQPFNISDREAASWRDFYTALAEQLEIDLRGVPVCARSVPGSTSWLARTARWPAEVFHGVVQIATSAEFKTLGRRILATKPIGTVPRAMIDRYPWCDRAIRKLVRADDSLPVWQPKQTTAGSPIAMGSAGARLSIDKALNQLGYESPVPQTESIPLTAAWARHAKVV